MAQRDEREQGRHAASRTARTVRKKRRLVRLVVACSGSFTAVLAWPILIVIVAGTVFGAAEAEQQSASRCGSAAPVDGSGPAAPRDRSGPTLPGTEDFTPSFMFDTSDIARVAAQAGFAGEDLVIAVAMARAESGGNPSAVNTANTNGTTDYGLWQINSVHIASGFDPAKYRDPAYNARWAYHIYKNAGMTWRPWVAYTNGSYREHLPVARAAVEDVGAVAVNDIPSRGGVTGVGECPSKTAVVAGQGPVSGRSGRAISFARQQLGDPYQWGAVGPDSWDCSSLVQAAWATAGIRLPRVSRDQHAALTPVAQSDIQPGDLIFYGDPVVRHVAMYTGNGMIIEAPSAGLTVRERAVYWTGVRGVGRPAA